MNSVKTYLLRLVLCGFLVSLAGLLNREGREKQLLRLCGGCLLLITAIRPLVSLDLSALQDRLGALGLPAPITREEASRRNDEILAELVAEQTERRILEQAEELGMKLSVRVTTARDPETGLFLPDRAELLGAWTPEERAALSAWISQSLDLDPERQTWRME